MSYIVHWRKSILVYHRLVAYCNPTLRYNHGDRPRCFEIGLVETRNKAVTGIWFEWSMSVIFGRTLWDINKGHASKSIIIVLILIEEGDIIVSNIKIYSWNHNIFTQNIRSNIVSINNESSNSSRSEVDRQKHRPRSQLTVDFS